MSEALLTDAIQSIVDDRRLAGACTLVWQGGKVLHAGATGYRDIELGLPIERDSLFRIASMTKPITSTLALMLFDEGRFALEEPITRWAPEFAHMRVLRSALRTHLSRSQHGGARAAFRWRWNGRIRCDRQVSVSSCRTTAIGAGLDE